MEKEKKRKKGRKEYLLVLLSLLFFLFFLFYYFLALVPRVRWTEKTRFFIIIALHISAQLCKRSCFGNNFICDLLFTNFYPLFQVFIYRLISVRKFAFYSSIIQGWGYILSRFFQHVLAVSSVNGNSALGPSS